jgi:hypothetical protein
VAKRFPALSWKRSGRRHFARRPAVIGVPEWQTFSISRAWLCRPGGVAAKSCFPGNRARTRLTAGTWSLSALTMIARSKTSSMASSSRVREKWTSVSFSSWRHRNAERRQVARRNCYSYSQAASACMTLTLRLNEESRDVAVHLRPDGQAGAVHRDRAWRRRGPVHAAPVCRSGRADQGGVGTEEGAGCRSRDCPTQTVWQRMPLPPTCSRSCARYGWRVRPRSAPSLRP